MQMGSLYREQPASLATSKFFFAAEARSIISRQRSTMSDLKTQIAQQLSEEQSKYTYFLLAAAASCIALSVQRTTGSAVTWKEVPLGVAVLCWGASFWAGCYNRAYHSTTLYANVALLQLADGTHANQPSHPQAVRAAMEGVAAAAEQNSTSANRWGKWQFWMLITGAMSFICWHIIGMIIQHPPPR